MLPGTELVRLVYISWVLARHGLDELLLASHLFRPVRHLRLLMPWTWVNRRASRGERIRRSLEELGPIFVKFGTIHRAAATQTDQQIRPKLGGPGDTPIDIVRAGVFVKVFEHRGRDPRPVQRLDPSLRMTRRDDARITDHQSATPPKLTTEFAQTIDGIYLEDDPRASFEIKRQQ